MDDELRENRALRLSSASQGQRAARGHAPSARPDRDGARGRLRGHRIVIRTTYEIEVDGQPVSGHLGVAKDGRVHYHPVPNLSFPSCGPGKDADRPVP